MHMIPRCVAMLHVLRGYPRQHTVCIMAVPSACAVPRPQWCWRGRGMHSYWCSSCCCQARCSGLWTMLPTSVSSGAIGRSKYLSTVERAVWWSGPAHAVQRRIHEHGASCKHDSCARPSTSSQHATQHYGAPATAPMDCQTIDYTASRRTAGHARRQSRRHLTRGNAAAAGNLHLTPS